MDKINAKYENVPWFSLEEWLDVYKNTFGNNLEGWKQATDQISVWRARVFRLPIGVEGTFPLLQAKIAQEEHFLDDAFRQSSLSLGILKFVSVATEGYEYRHLIGHAMHNAACKINLPPYLIDLRNDIIHCDHVYGSQTLKSALDNCLQWVKTNYWEVEERNIKENRAFEMKRGRKRRGSDEENETDDPVVIASSRNLISFIQQFVTSSLRTSQDKALAEQQLERELLKLQTLIKSYLYRNPDDCITVLVDHLFYHPFLRKLKTQTASRCKLHCRCRFNRGVIVMGTRVLHYLLKFDLLNSFVRQLIARGKDYPRLLSGWMHMLANTTFSDVNGRCRKHRFLFKEDTLRNAINWKLFLYQLLTLNEIWASDLALEISQQNFSGIDNDSRDILKRLIGVYSSAERPSEQFETVVSCPKHMNGNGVFDLPTVMLKAKKELPEQTLKYVNGIYDLVGQTTHSDSGVRKYPLSEKYLGVLPHQEGDPFLYQQLELSSGHSPNKKIRGVVF